MHSESLAETDAEQKIRLQQLAAEYCLLLSYLSNDNPQVVVVLLVLLVLLLLLLLLLVLVVVMVLLLLLVLEVVAVSLRHSF